MKNSKLFIYLLFTSFLMLLSYSIFSQDTTIINPENKGVVYGLSITQIAWIVVGVYEVIARYVPTSKNWSVLHSIIKIIDVIFPNKATPEKIISGGNETTIKKIFGIFKKPR